MEQTRVELYRVLPATAAEGWFILAPMLERALEQTYGEYSLEDVAIHVANGDWQLWTAVEHALPVATMVTELIKYPQIKICRWVLLSGEGFKQWKSLLFQIEDWALMQGCTAFEAFARPGMEKLARSMGFREQYRVIVKDLRGTLQ